MLQGLLEAWGYEVVLAVNGHEAQSILDSDDAPHLAILDVSMPLMSGLELCSRIRGRKHGYVYTILLSGDDDEGDVLQGFENIPQAFIDMLRGKNTGKMLIQA